MALRGTSRELTAIAEGGSQRTVWAANDAVMMLTGQAEIVCQGEALQVELPKVEREAEVF
jgi:diaminopimelate epimerase